MIELIVNKNVLQMFLKGLMLLCLWLTRCDFTTSLKDCTCLQIKRLICQLRNWQVAQDWECRYFLNSFDWVQSFQQFLWALVGFVTKRTHVRFFFQRMCHFWLNISHNLGNFEHGTKNVKGRQSVNFQSFSREKYNIMNHHQTV